MSAPRPIGHVAANLGMLALAIRFRIRQSAAGSIHVCWRTDDGCLYLEPAAHPTARAIERASRHLVIARYQKEPGLSWSAVMEDLERARMAFAAESLADAVELAACP